MFCVSLFALVETYRLSRRIHTVEINQMLHMSMQVPSQSIPKVNMKIFFVFVLACWYIPSPFTIRVYSYFSFVARLKFIQEYQAQPKYVTCIVYYATINLKCKPHVVIII